MLRLIIVDSSVISGGSPKNNVELAAVLSSFRAQGIKIAIVSTNNLGMLKASRTDFPFSFDYSLSGEEIYKNPQNCFKGGGERITVICSELGVKPQSTLYIGDDRHDYASSLHSGCFFVVAEWKSTKGNYTAVTAARPRDVWRFASHYLMHSPRWNFSLDLPDKKLTLRTLASANTHSNEVRFVCDPPRRSFNLKQLFKDKLPLKCGHQNAAAIMFWHALSSLILEGLAGQDFIFTIYPGSKPKKDNEVVQQMANIASKILRGRFFDDLIVRVVAAPSSHEQKQNGKDSFLTQTNTVILNADYKKKIVGRTIVVFDDFHTTGKSFEWARNLLISAGAKEVIMVAPGRFGGKSKPHTLYTPRSEDLITPFELREYSDEDFISCNYQLTPRAGGTEIIQRSFAKLQTGEPYFPIGEK